MHRSGMQCLGDTQLQGQQNHPMRSRVSAASNPAQREWTQSHIHTTEKYMAPNPRLTLSPKWSSVCTVITLPSLGVEIIIIIVINLSGLIKAPSLDDCWYPQFKRPLMLGSYSVYKLRLNTFNLTEQLGITSRRCKIARMCLWPSI